MGGDCPGHCSKLAPVLMDYQYLFIQLFFVPNISLFVYNQLYLLWISFLFTQIVASIYPRACAITFPQLGKFGKNKEKCMPPHSNVFQLLRDKYESNTLQIFIEYRTNDNWIHAKYELTTHKKRNVQKGKSCLPGKLSTSHTLGDLSGRNFSRGITCRLPKVPQISPTWPRTPEISSALTENSKNFATYHQKRHKFHQLWPQILPTLTKSITNFTNLEQKQHKYH